MRRLALALALCGVACGPSGGVTPAATTERAPGATAADAISASVVPSDSALPRDSLGMAMRRGRALLEHTPDSLRQYVPANLRCFSCHLDAGRREWVSPLVGSFAQYPRYVDRAGAVASIEDRVNYCMTRSLAGRPLATDSREMRDIVSYLAYLSRNVPVGVPVRGAGIAPIQGRTGDSARGSNLFVSACVRCHGANGEGMRVAPNGRDTLLAPALWGAHSFSIAAGLARLPRAAGFIRRAMPYDRPGTLTDQDAVDVAAFVLSHPRPDYPPKAHDWPHGDAPADVPYATPGHVPAHPAPVLPVAIGK